MTSPIAKALRERGYDDRTILRTLALWRVLYNLDEVCLGTHPRSVWIMPAVVTALVTRWGMCSDGPMSPVEVPPCAP